MVKSRDLPQMGALLSRIVQRHQVYWIKHTFERS
jgi:hypothetical protein